MKNVNVLAAVAFVSGALVSTQAIAAPVLTSFTNASTSVGGDFNVGYQFVANSDLTISQLGFYDAGGNGLASTHAVGIFDLTGHLLGSVNVGAASTTLINGFRYAALTTALNLISGVSYRIAGTTSGSDAWVYDANNLATSGITYQGSYFNDSKSLAAITAFAPGREYFTVNALTGAVPEPATWAMMLVGFGLIAATMRYRRRSTTTVYA